MRKSRYYIGLSLLLALPALAAELQPLQEIRDAAQHFVESQLEGGLGETVVTVGELDNRLRLAQCEEPLQAYFPNQVKPVGNITVGVRCEGAKPWSLLVQSRIEQFVEVVVAARPLGRNQTLASGDLALSRTDIARLSGGYFTSLEEASGMVLRRSVTSGTVLGTSLLSPAILVKRGEKVMIQADSGPIRVRMEGQALASGARGEVIQVKNLSSQQVIEVEVVSAGAVRVRL